jgi:hypothetical protein
MNRIFKSRVNLSNLSTHAHKIVEKDNYNLADSGVPERLPKISCSPKLLAAPSGAVSSHWRTVCGVRVSLRSFCAVDRLRILGRPSLDTADSQVICVTERSLVPKTCEPCSKCLVSWHQI